MLVQIQLIDKLHSPIHFNVSLANQELLLIQRIEQSVSALLVKDMTLLENHVFVMMKEIHLNQIKATHLLVFATHAQLAQPETLVMSPNVSVQLDKDTTILEDHVFVTMK